MLDQLKQRFNDNTLAWILLIGAAILPFVSSSGNYAAQTVALGAAYAIALMGVDFVVGYAGMITVGHAAVFGVGAYASAALTVKYQLPVPLSLLASIGFGALAGWILSLPALRANDKYVALATLVTGLAFHVLFVETTPITNGSIGLTLGAQELLGFSLGPMQYAMIGLALAAACMVLVNRMSRSAMGRAFEALRDSAVAADCLGISTARYKQYAFILSGVFCGLAGGLFSFSQGYIAPNSFAFETSVTLLLALMLGGKKTRSGALIGAAVVIYLPVALSSVETFRWVAGIVLLATAILSLRAYFRGATEVVRMTLVPLAAQLFLFTASFFVHSMIEWRPVIYGSLILGVIYYLPRGLAGLLPKIRHKIKAKGSAQAVHPIQQDGAFLEMSDVGMSFGGFKALEGVTAKVAAGEIVGVIGPNGAGKSTLMNVITGVYEPTSGTATFKGIKIAGLDSARIAALGIARTFQNLQIFGGLTAIENVMVGLHREHETNLAVVALGLSDRKDAQARERAQALLDFVGLHEKANELAADLSYGEQRYLEIARALATNPRLLLLDEPAAGLRGEDLVRLKDIIAEIRSKGVAVMVIEHHMDVIVESCQRALAFNFGRLIAQGKPNEVLAAPAVKEAYLGTDA